LSEPWIFDELYNTPETTHISTESEFQALVERQTRTKIFAVTIALTENPFIADEQKQEFEDSLNSEEKEARIHGRFTHLMGRVYKKFEPDKHVIHIEDLEDIANDHPGDPSLDFRTWPSGIVTDPHDRRPFACAWFVVSPRDEIIFLEEWPTFDFYDVKQWSWDVDQYADYFKSHERRLQYQPLSWLIMDPRFGNAPKAITGTTLRDEFGQRGLDFDCNFNAQDVETGHMMVRQRVRAGQILVEARCQNLIKGMLNYVYEDHRRRGEDKPSKERPKEMHKDWADLVRYVVMYDVWYESPETTRPQFREMVNLGLGGEVG
jgi:hypothetical protein